MEKLNSNMHSKLSECVIERLSQRKILTVMDFIIEDQDKLRTVTDLSFKVRLMYCIYHCSALVFVFIIDFHNQNFIQEVMDVKKNLAEKFGGILKKPSNLWKLEQSNVVCTKIKRY